MGDPWLCVAKCMSNWNAILFQMTFILCWLLIMMALSGYYKQNDGGSFANVPYPVTFFNQTIDIYPFKSWDDVCSALPYTYVRPFSFTFSPNGSNPTFCGYGDANTNLRLVISVFGFVTMLCLYVHTPLSFFARYVYLVYGFLFFTALVLDSNSSSMGDSMCQSGFANTNMMSAIALNDLNVVCNVSVYATVAIIDFILSVQFFFLATSWALCEHKYPNAHKNTSEQKAFQQMQNNSTSGGNGGKGNGRSSLANDDDLI